MDNILHKIKEYSEEDKNLINSAFDKLLLSFENKPNSTKKKKAKIISAFNFAAKAHKNQKRKSGEAYFIHPVEVALICSEEINLGATSIVCALLHDVVEDTPVSIEEIEEIFGSKVAMIVGGLTKLDGSYKAVSLQAENFKKILSTLIEDVRVVLVKMADRLHNLRTISALPHKKQLKIGSETEYVYTPLAYRLGLFNIKTEFEDICLRIKEPDLYSEIENKLSETAKTRDKYIEKFTTPLEKGLKGLGIKNRMFGRIKSIYSISKKMKAQEVPFEEVYDLFAVRIIVDAIPKEEKGACWQVYSLITDTYRPVTNRLRDWLSNPKSNGYESLHTTIIGPEGKYVEVQIRSERMDEIAEKGFAAHWKYKGVDNQRDVYEQWLDSVRDSLENQNGDTIEFLEDFKANNLFHKEVYVYTPNGDMKILPEGASALDFAFSIHTDVGYHCSAIKVGKRLVPMGYKLKNGDQLEVITSKNQRPTEDWLKIVVTGKARSQVRAAMREVRQKKGEFGKEALARKLKKLKVKFEENIDVLVQYFNYTTHTDFFYDIAMDNFSVLEITKHFSPIGGKLVEIKKDEEKAEPAEVVEIKRPRKDKDTFIKPRLLINGEDAKRFEFTFASCCNPVQGDDIFAFLTTTAGLKIHRTNCPNATNMMAHYGYRVMKAEWVVTQDSKFVATLKIIGVDDGPGVIETISHELSSQLGLNIRSFSIEGDEGYYEGRVGVLVSNTDQLNTAMKVLQNLAIVSSVQRIN